LADYLARDKFPWLLAVPLFLVSRGFSLFFLDAVFWDDWTLVDVRPEVILEVFRQSGSIGETGHLHNALLTVGPAAYRIFTLLLLFACAVLVWAIMRTLRGISPTDRNLVTLLFLCAPLYAASVSLMVFPNTLRIFFFFMAWYLLVVRRSAASRVASLALFALSFNTASLLVFYALPFLHFAMQSATKQSLRTPSTLLSLAAFGALPLLHWFIQLQFFRPSGVFVDYNRIHTQYLLGDLPWVVAGAVYTVATSLGLRHVQSDRIKGLLLVPVGLWMLWLAILPYRAIGWGVPLSMWWEHSFIEWASRYQLLMPLGFAVVVASLDKALRFRVTAIVALLTILGSAIHNLGVGAEYYVDWIKQKEVIQHLARSDDVRRARTILFEDEAPHFNARSRTYRFYEYNGWLKRAYGDETRFAMDRKNWSGPMSEVVPASYAKNFSEAYNAGQYVAGAPDLVVRIRAGNGRLRTLLTGSGNFHLEVSLPPRS
jgi:hypothetical protein